VKFICADVAKKRPLDRYIVKDGRDVVNLLDETDARDLIQKLTAFAVRAFAMYGMFGRAAVMPGVGMSAEDFASDLMIEYVTGKIKIKTLPYLYTALLNNIRDKLGSSAQKTTDHIPMNTETNADGERTKGLDGYSSEQMPIVDYLCEESYKARVRACAEGDPNLEEIVVAVFDLEMLKPAEIADFLGITAEEFHVRKRKLGRRLVKHEIKMVPS
jgi:DNA-directed RNA polymerase specialized sigma24 family protein